MTYVINGKRVVVSKAGRRLLIRAARARMVVGRASKAKHHQAIRSRLVEAGLVRPA